MMTDEVLIVGVAVFACAVFIGLLIDGYLAGHPEKKEKITKYFGFGLPIDRDQASEQVQASATGVGSANETRKSSINFGTLVFGSFSLLSLLVCFAKGIVPIYLGESVLWAAVAWYWHKKSPWSETATGIVLLLAVGVAAGEGYLLGRQSLGNNYTYLTQGNLQYRVNAGTGRTDRLDIRSGWVPVSFDKPPETISTDQARSIGLSNGSWKNGISDTAGEICFDVQNDSHYVLQQVAILVNLDVSAYPQPPGATCNPVDEIFGFCGHVMLSGGLLNVGKATRFCGRAWRPFPTGAKWSYSTSTMTGWKQ